MTIATSCCLKLSPAPPTTSSSSTRPQQQVSTREVSWRKQCLVGMACVIVGLQSEGLMGNHGGNMAAAANLEAVVKSKGKEKRWSDERICPPWQVNSLETIVPENLPRRSFKRRWESVGDHHSKAAPPVRASTTTTTTTTTNKNCFSM